MSHEAVPAQKTGKYALPESVYNYLKAVVQIWLPAAATLYFTLGTIWGWPNIEQVIGSLTAVTLFFGAILGISTKSYNNSDAKYDGALRVDETDPETPYVLDATTPVNELIGKREISFKVVNKEPR